MRYQTRLFVIFLISTLAGGCASTIKTACPDGSLRSVPRKCGSVVKYQPPTIDSGVFELPILHGVSIPARFDGERLNPEVIQIASRGVKVLDSRRTRACGKMSRFVCKEYYHVLQSEIAVIDRSLQSLADVVTNSKTKAGLENGILRWYKRFIRDEQFYKHLDDGDNFLTTGDYDKAVREYETALESGKSAEPFYRLGLVYWEWMKSGRDATDSHRKKAMDSFIQCGMLDQDYQRCSYHIALLYLLRDDPDDEDVDEAYKTLNTLRQQNVGGTLGAYVRYYLAVIALRRGEVKEGRRILTEVLGVKDMDLYLGIFAGYNLGLAEVSLAAESSGTEKEDLTRSAIERLIKSSKLALKEAHRDLKVRLFKHHLRYRDDVLSSLHSRPEWADIEISFGDLPF